MQYYKNMHHTKDKADLAVAKVILDLTEKDFVVFLPAITEHCRFDLMCYNEQDGSIKRIQVKYNKNGKLCNKTSWNDKHGSHSKKYKSSDFDYYALYMPDIDKVVYPNISFKGAKIASTVPNSYTPFYYWEDFINFTDKTNKRTINDFGITLTYNKKNYYGKNQQ